MIRHQKRWEYPPARPLSNWAIALGAVIVLAIAVFAGVILGHRYGGAGASVELDAIRTAGALVVGTGGAVALLLAARRQRSTELTLVHTEHDATERRITELYTKAADQLGSDQAPVRLAGLYALERLAHSTVEHRQTIVDVICAYLRMPYALPPPETPQAGTRYRGSRPRRRRQSLSNDHHSRSVPTPADRHQQPRQERQVRLTAQDILARNLRLPPESRRRWWDRWRRVYREPPWPGIRLELAGALLLDFRLSACTLARADFTGAQFVGVTSFRGTQFGLAFFDRAQFTGPASFDRAQFTGLASFDGAQFSSTASMGGPQFTNEASVSAYFTSKAFDTYFTSMASFDATFADAQFAGWTNFHNARFAGWTHFQRARFPGWASFEGAQFTSPAFFDDARFTDRVSFDHARFTGPARFRGAQFTGLASFKNAQFSFTAAQFPGLSPLACLQFTGPVDFAGAHISGPGMETVLPPGWKTRPAQLDKGEDPAARYLVQSEDPAGYW